jgi:hypothetical protein
MCARMHIYTNVGIHLENYHTQFSKEQNQVRHMCAQEVHTYNDRIEISKQCSYTMENILY